MPDAEVTGVRVLRSLRTEVSRITFLEVSLGGNEAPMRMVFKAALPGQRSFDAMRTEMRFYVNLAPRFPGEGLVRFLGRGVHGQMPFLLLEDLSGDFTSTTAFEALPAEHCGAAVDLLARIHACWRGRVGAPKVQSLEAVVARIRNRNARFAQALGDALGDDLRKAWDTVFRSGGRPWVPLMDAGNMTLTHGDAHSGNFLYPRTPEGQGVRLIDWQYWTLDMGVRDLSFLMALHWPSDARARLERTLLERYHQRLVEEGVRDYPWETCWREYRLAAARNLFVADAQWARGRPRQGWMPLLRNALAAFHDLDCAELLKP